jgi:hypothetical protein
VSDRGAAETKGRCGARQKIAMVVWRLKTLNSTKSKKKTKSWHVRVLVIMDRRGPRARGHPRFTAEDTLMSINNFVHLPRLESRANHSTLSVT